jgi:hypothetical protein
MPSKSSAQHRAMEAAAHGHSTLGIPAKVGREFVRADEGKHEKGEWNSGHSGEGPHYKHKRKSHQ